MRVANVVAAALFALSVAVQHNDPDPIRWMAIYGAALGVCIGWERGARVRAPAWTVAAIATVWAAAAALGTRLTAGAVDALTDWTMHAGGSEELRESLGLALVAGWMGCLGLWNRRDARVLSPPGDVQKS